MMKHENFVTVDGIKVPIEGEKNLLELIRKANIEIPTFCYHSELSVYGACRLCLVDIEGRGLCASCSTPPSPGLKVRTNTREIREIRKITLELLLANHDQSCPTCERSDTCKLRDLAAQLGIEDIRFKKAVPDLPLDKSSPCLVRDPNKCVLCGDCVRFCSEVQGIGAIDFVSRGSGVTVQPAFGKSLADVECVFCGQCAAVCPTGAITIKSDVNTVWDAIDNPEKTVIAQIAPAVRVAIGEMFHLDPGTITTGRIVSAMKMMGFDRVFDTSFSADLTVIEEANEFLGRKAKGEKLPIFTSCCPAWVKFVEQYYSDLIPHLSSCRSPQQMFGSLAKDVLCKEMNRKAEDLVVVSIMPCTAKKFEAGRPEFAKDGVRDVDIVITTQELGKMIKESGIRFTELAPESMDMPLGFHTGAGVIFGNSGGVSEAVLRYAYEKVTGSHLEKVDFTEVRGEEGLREAEITLDGVKLRLAIVHGLKNARTVAEMILAGKKEYDIVEVMSCPGGCIGGAGQPIANDISIRKQRTNGLYNSDKLLQLHKSQENPFIKEFYEKNIGEINGHKAHEMLHTHYCSRCRIKDEELELINGSAKKHKVKVCVGTGCYLKGSQDILHSLIKQVEEENLQNSVEVQATFCLERCGQGPNAAVDDEVIGHATAEKVMALLKSKMNKCACCGKC